MEKPNGHKKIETIVLNSEPLIFKKRVFSLGNTMYHLKTPQLSTDTLEVVMVADYLK